MKIINRKNKRDLAGKEIFEIQPIILGGNPTDPNNKTVLNREDHIRAVNYWNRIIRDLRKDGGGGGVHRIQRPQNLSGTDKKITDLGRKKTDD